MSDYREEFEGSVLEKEKTEAREPKQYKVFLLNDDYTPMDFVVQVLVSIFRKEATDATRIMLDIHKRGRGLGGVFTYDIAGTKVEQVKTLATQNGHPLKCLMERK